MKSATAEEDRIAQGRVGIVGLGYVGLPLMLRFSEVGYRVLGLDIDKRPRSRR
jgi:UDP-N-acetyl-D-glucosamine dehydrogenase